MANEKPFILYKTICILYIYNIIYRFLKNMLQIMIKNYKENINFKFRFKLRI